LGVIFGVAQIFYLFFDAWDGRPTRPASDTALYVCARPIDTTMSNLVFDTFNSFFLPHNRIIKSTIRLKDIIT